MPRSASPSSTSRSSSVIPAVRSTTWLKTYAAVSANITRRVRPNRVPGSKRKIGNAASNAMRRRTSTVGRVPTNAMSSNAMRNAADSGREKIRSAGAASASLPSETRVRSHSNAATMTSSSSPNTASCTPESRANWTIERAVFRNACLACAPTDAALGSANAFQSGGLCRSHNCLRWSARCISSALISASTQSWVSATFPWSASNSSRRAFAFALRRPYGRQCTLDTVSERRRELLRRCGVAGVLPLLPEVVELGQGRVELRHQARRVCAARFGAAPSRSSTDLRCRAENLRDSAS